MSYAEGFDLGTARNVVRQLWRVELGVPHSEGQKVWLNQTVTRFMNRLLGLELRMQSSMFAWFNYVFWHEEEDAKKEGSLDRGVEGLRGDVVEAVQEEPVVSW